MEFFDVLERRRSVRLYRGEKPDAEKLQAILEAARLAPSAGDLQAFRIAIAEDAKTKSALAAAAHGQGFIAGASAVLVFLADPARSAAKYGKRGRSLFALQDATIAAAHAQLAATALGLGSCWVGAFDDDAVSRALRAPGELRPIALLPIGEPGEAPERTPRRPREALMMR